MIKQLPNGNLLVLESHRIPGGISTVPVEITPDDPKYEDLMAYIRRMQSLFSKPKPKQIS